MYIPNKIIIVDDHPLILGGISYILESYFPETHIIECRTGKQFISRTLEEKPELAITDIVLPDISGIYAVQQVKERMKDLRVIFISGLNKNEVEYHCIASGGDFLLSKEETGHKLAESIKSLFNSEISLQTNKYTKVDSRANKLLGFEFEVFDNILSRHEKKIFSQVGHGIQRNKIVEKSMISSKTYDKHCENIKRKLDLKCCNELKTLAVNYISFYNQTRNKNRQ
jgi:DNA-binding NarL/FixJ family response regulator